MGTWFIALAVVVVVVALVALAWWSSGRARGSAPTLDRERVQGDAIAKVGPPRTLPPPMSG